MYVRTKNKMQILFIFCIILALLFCFGMSKAIPKQVSAETGQQPLSMEYDDVEEELTISVAVGGDCQYQYWIKQKVTTDDNTENEVKEQSIWTMLQSYTDEDEKVFDYDSSYLIDGVYSIIVRVKDADGLVVEYRGAFNLADVNQLVLSDVTVNDNMDKEVFIAVKSNDTVSVNIFTSFTEGVTYSLNCKGAPTTNDGGSFTVDISEIENGLYTWKATASYGATTVTKDIKVYVSGGYKEEEVPVIQSLTGQSDDNGFTTFTMQVTYADGSNISSDDIGNFDYIIKSNGKDCSYVSAINNEDEEGILEIKYTTDYENKYGIYYTTGSIKRSGSSEKDDEIIRYYEGYNIRDITLEQTADTYEAPANQAITITSSATLVGNNDYEDFYYAYYREDASGWILIKDYGENGAATDVFTWTPSRSGTYNIQTRVKAGITGSEEDGFYQAGSYEKAVTKQYTITGTDLSGELSVKLCDSKTGLPYLEDLNTLEAGIAYRIVADYSGAEENVLYMFTVTNANTGLKYLNKYTTSNYIMFVPNKLDTYILSARIISSDNYGYKDDTDSLTVTTTKGAADFVYDLSTVKDYYFFQNGKNWTEGPEADLTMVEYDNAKKAAKVTTTANDATALRVQMVVGGSNFQIMEGERITYEIEIDTNGASGENIVLDFRARPYGGDSYNFGGKTVPFENGICKVSVVAGDNFDRFLLRIGGLGDITNKTSAIFYIRKVEIDYSAGKEEVVYDMSTADGRSIVVIPEERSLDDGGGSGSLIRYDDVEKAIKIYDNGPAGRISVELTLDSISKEKRVNLKVKVVSTSTDTDVPRFRFRAAHTAGGDVTYGDPFNMSTPVNGTYCFSACTQQDCSSIWFTIDMRNIDSADRANITFYIEQIVIV